MNVSISDFFYSFPERSLPVGQASEYVAYTQNDFYFKLAALKNGRRERLQAYFAAGGIQKILLGANISGFAFELEGVRIESLDKGFFKEDDPQEIVRKTAYLEDALVIINNNDVGHHGEMAYYARFFSQCEKTVFVAWDWDNHHWLDVSTFLAVHSDIYAPAHHENLYLLTRFNWLTAGPVYCATVQWSQRYLAEHLPEMMTHARSDAPLGMHIPYSPFRFRMQVITTLHQHFSSIGFSDRTFHSRTYEDRLKEWCAYKAHWICPVLNDVPIRIFDALITGGIPIVPESLRFLPPVCDIGREHIVFYSPQDVIQPHRVVERAVGLFDSGGAEKLAERHLFALTYHHGTGRLKQMVKYVMEAYDLKVNGMLQPGLPGGGHDSSHDGLTMNI